MHFSLFDIIHEKEKTQKQREEEFVASSYHHRSEFKCTRVFVYNTDVEMFVKHCLQIRARRSCSFLFGCCCSCCWLNEWVENEFVKMESRTPHRAKNNESTKMNELNWKNKSNMVRINVREWQAMDGNFSIQFSVCQEMCDNCAQPFLLSLLRALFSLSVLLFLSNRSLAHLLDKQLYWLVRFSSTFSYLFVNSKNYEL